MIGARAIAYVGLGSNLAGPRRQVEEAIGELAELAGCRLRAHSWLYVTKPVGPRDQPDFINAAAALETRLAPADLLSALQGIELRHERTRTGRRWGPRTLDLDLLLHGTCELLHPGLTLPHPEIRRRAFVLVPLADIAPPDLWIPGQGRLGELLGGCPLHGVARLDGCPAGIGVGVEPPLSCC